MLPLLLYGGCFLLGLLAGRSAGWKAWFLLPALFALSIVYALAAADPFGAVVGVLGALAATPGVLIGVLRHRKAEAGRAETA